MSPFVLRYEVPPDSTLQYAYSEITVPEGQDLIGSFFMANGFSEGYFGIQVNGPCGQDHSACQPDDSNAAWYL